MNKIVLLFAFSLMSSISFSQSIVGTWKTVDDNDGTVKSKVEITEKDGKYYGTVVELVNPSIEICEKCKGDKKNKPIKDMEILWDVEKESKTYGDDGKIVDPSSGKIYSCKLELKEPNKLTVRGYLGMSLFGRSQTWLRAE